MMKNPIAKLSRKTRMTSDMRAGSRLKKEDSYLRKIGWFESVFQEMPVDEEGSPLPWFTYAAIEFLDTRMRKSMAVFEYGSGNSTLWWSGRVSRVVSCEHDRSWYARMSPRLPSHVDYLLFDLVPGGDYSKAVGRYREEFDIIVIDGRDRVNCAKNALQALKHDGVIIWDNSDRERYTEGYAHLSAGGFKRLDFAGMGPINAYAWCTSIFYRNENCLDI